MRNSKIYLVVLLSCVVASSCIDRFYLNQDDNAQNKLVIEGIFTNEAKEQEIVISRSTSVEFPRFMPQTGCQVTIEDDHGNKLILPESVERGHYRAIASDQFARIGSFYRLTVKTPYGHQYESSFDELMPCPKVDSVYYEVKIRPTSTIGEDEQGLQFYIDFKGDNSMGRFFRWKLEETYEYHSTWAVNRYLDEKNEVKIVLEDLSNYVCYKTDSIGNIFTLSTNGFVQNSYTKNPLLFVNNETQRLMHFYSLFVKQYSLTEEAYNFWENLRKNNKQTGFLYGKQPATYKSNIRNVNDTTETVLGYFGVSAVSAKRINIKSVPGLTFNKVFYCQAVKKNMRLDSIPRERPLYLYPFMRRDGSIFWVWGDTDCFLCKLLGGTTEEPSFRYDK